MATYTQIIYHLVYSTKNREKILLKENRQAFFEYRWGILKNKRHVLPPFSQVLPDFLK